MSKYNIDEMLCHSLFNYLHTKSKLNNPCFIYAIANKFGKNKKIIDELNATCHIVFTNDTITFKPNIRREILRNQSRPKIKYVRNYVRNYVKKLLDDLGFDAFVYHNEQNSGSVYVSLRNTKNKTRIQQLGNVFKFDCDTPVLTQTILDSLTENHK